MDKRRIRSDGHGKLDQVMQDAFGDLRADARTDDSKDIRLQLF